MAGTVCGQDEAEPFALAGDAPEMSGEVQRPHRTPRWLAALGATALAVAGAAAAVARAGRPVSAPAGQKLVRLSTEALPKHAELHAIFQDFKTSGDSGGHPDFQPDRSRFPGDTRTEQKGLVKPDLHPVTGLPQWNDCAVSNGNTPCSLTSEDNFKEWFEGSERSKPVPMTFTLQEKYGNEGVWEINHPNFFPLNGIGWNDVHPGIPNNYYFTMQAWKTFVYHGGEYFKFRGDDDLWVFFNGRIGLDIGGLHAPIEETIKLDDLAAEAGLEIGKTFFLNIFFAERAYYGSNFIIETNIQFNEDGCHEHDRISVQPSLYMPSASNAFSLVLTWDAFSVVGGEDEGTKVKVSFKCGSDEDCDTDQPSPSGYFPSISLVTGKTMPLTLEIVDEDDPEFAPSDVYVTFYDLESGMAIFAEGVTEYTLLKTSYIEYEKQGVIDFFVSTAPAGMKLATFPDELTEDNQKMAVSLKFSDLSTAKITLTNSREDGEDALFKFTMTPMFECVPCFPASACEANQPVAQTRTTTTTTVTIHVEEETTKEIVLAGVDNEGDDQCCFFDHFGFSFACYPEKPWWIPWCEGETVYPWSSWPVVR